MLSGEYDLSCLVELAVRDFAGFRGFHSFRFCEGFNLLQDSCGSGKTNLVMALEFALFGRTRGRSAHSLINYLHRGDCERRGAMPGCEVSAVFRCDGRGHRVKRRMVDSGDGLKQTEVFDSEFIDMFPSEGFEKIVIWEQDLASLGGLSMGESTPILVLNSVAGNFCDSVGIVILDGVFGRLAREMRVELLSRLSSIGLNQIILLESLGFDRSLMERFITNIVELSYPLIT
jgi:hypothetical protein